METMVDSCLQELSSQVRIQILFKNWLIDWFWMRWGFIAVGGLPLAVASRGHSVAVRWLLFGMASLVTEHELPVRELQ